jgi:hypothetical protein
MEYKKIDLVTENEFNDFDREESKKYVVNWFMNESKNPYLLKDDSAMAYKLAYYILKDEDEISPYSADSIIFNFWITMYHSDINKKRT